MADMRRFLLADLLLLALVVAVAAGARAGYLFACADGGSTPGPLRVQEAPGELSALIDSVREHLWFGGRAPFAEGEEVTAHVSPGYPWLVGLLGRYVPSDRVDSTVRWAQVGLGALTAGFYFLFARRAFRSLAVGTLAGLFAALHPFWVINVAEVNDGTLASFALGAALLLGSQAGEKGGPLTSLLLGLSLAGLALVRAALLPYSFVALVWFLLRSRSLPSGWLCGLLAFLGFGIGLGPWTVRNYQLFGEPVPVVSSTYLHLWIGNNPGATGGPATKTWGEAPEGLSKTANQPARYAQLARKVAQEWSENPARSIRRRLMAGLMFFTGERWLDKDNSTLAVKTSDGAEMPGWLADGYEVTLQAVLCGLLVLGLLGWRLTYGWRWESVPATLAMIAVPLPYVLGHAEALSGPRLPLDGVLLCYAAFVVCAFLPRVGAGLLEGPDPREPRSASG